MEEQIKEMLRPENLTKLALFIAAYGAASAVPVVGQAMNAYMIGNAGIEFAHELHEIYLQLDGAIDKDDIQIGVVMLGNQFAGGLMNVIMTLVLGGAGRRKKQPQSPRPGSGGTNPQSPHPGSQFDQNLNRNTNKHRDQAKKDADKSAMAPRTGGQPKQHRHHTIPKEIQKKLPEHLQNDPDIIGRPGLPNRRMVDADHHMNVVHDKRGISTKKTGIYGGKYNLRFDEEIKKIGYDIITKQQILDIRDLLVKEFGL
jgi:hypothetical protein